MQINTPSAHGPFDIVGDVHGCLDELLALMASLGCQVKRQVREFEVTPPQGRTLAFAGDLASRGPNSAGLLRLVMQLVQAGHAICVPGNQDMKLTGALKGSIVQPTPGLARSLEQFACETAELRPAAVEFLESLPSHLVLDDGKLVIAHAGLPERMQGSNSARARAFALAGETTGETDQFGLPVRLNWAASYRGSSLVVFGHTPVTSPLWLNNTVNIDTGCVYGGYLTALRYPELETMQVAAHAVYYRSNKQFPPHPGLSAQGSTA